MAVGKDCNNKDLDLTDCLYCGKGFDKKAMALHKIEEEKTLHCIYCDMYFDSLLAFRRHMYRYHKMYSCSKCNLQFLKGAYEYHMRSVHSNHPQCDICGKTFATQRSLMTHSKKIHRGQRDMRWKCMQCNYQAPDNYQYSVHLARHRKAPTLVCDQCGVRKYTPTELRKHIQVDHLGGYRCTICEKVFRCSAYLKKHMLSHNNQVSKTSLSCEECGKVFSANVTLKRHLLKHRNKLPVFRCDCCGKQVSSKQSYAAHLRMHTGLKPYTCDTCHKDFAEKRYLRWHQKQHNFHIS